MNKKEGRFFSPQMKMVEVCHKCRACVYACPAKAIEWGVGEIVVDRYKCAQYVLNRDECFNCVAECHQGAIAFDEYELKDGKIIKIEK